MLRPTSLHRLAAVCLLCAAGACSNSDVLLVGRTANFDGNAALSKASAASESAAQPPVQSVGGSSRQPLAGRLALGASQRPELAVRPERLFEQLALEDVELLRTRQAVGATLGASYCVTSRSAEGLGLAVCEFVDDASAKLGEARSHELFDRLIAGRTLIRNENTLLTLTSVPTDAAKTESARAAAIFASLVREQQADP